MTGKRAAGLAATVALLGSCIHTDLPRPPGTVNLSEPPTPLHSYVLEPALDDGERVFVVSPGLFGAAGVRATRDLSAHGSLGLELGLRYASSATSHADEGDNSLLAFAFIQRFWGINIGWTPLMSGAGPAPALSGPLHLEIEHLHDAMGLAAGWVWVPAQTAHGPQLTGSVGPLFIRGVHVIGHHSTVQVGLFVKFPLAWVWAR